MPKDEFETLERRWRERPLFLQTPRRRPLRLVLYLTLAIATFLVLAAVGVPSTERLLERFATFSPYPPADHTAQAGSPGVPLRPTHQP